MKNAINFSFINSAGQYRSSNPVVNAVLLLFILVLFPILIVAGIIALIVIAVIARFRTITHLFRSERKNHVSESVHFEPHNSADDGEGFADYSIVDEKIGR